MAAVYTRFREAVEARDLQGMVDCLAEDIRFYSPVKFTPFEGKEVVTGLFGVLLRTFQDFRYVGALSGTVEHGDGGEPVESDLLVFRATVANRSVHGVDLLQANDDDLIDAFTVMIRPLSAVQVVGEAIWAGLVEDGIVTVP